MKIGWLTLLCLLPFAVWAVSIGLLWQQQREWWRAHRERERVYHFWRDQCNEALAKMADARDDAEYERWNATKRVNMRRYEKEVLGR